MIESQRNFQIAPTTAISLFQSVIAVFSSAAGCLWANGLSYRKNVFMLLPGHAVSTVPNRNA